MRTQAFEILGKAFVFLLRKDRIFPPIYAKSQIYQVSLDDCFAAQIVLWRISLLSLTLGGFVADGLVSIKEAAKRTGVSVAEFRRLAGL